MRAVERRRRWLLDPSCAIGDGAGALEARRGLGWAPEGPSGPRTECGRSGQSPGDLIEIAILAIRTLGGPGSATALPNPVHQRPTGGRGRAAPRRPGVITLLYVFLLYIFLIYMCGHGHGACHYHGRGLVQLLIMRILHEKPSHGYQIMEDLGRMTSKNYVPEPGAIYTMLRRMEERGLLASRWESKESGADRRVYTLTEAGVRALREGLEIVKRRRDLMDDLIRFYDIHFG